MRFDPYVNFTAGEISPQLRGRVDIDAYRHAASTMRNFQPLQYGGVRRRFGTERMRGTFDTATRSRLLPFVLGVGQAYVIELSNLIVMAHLMGENVAPTYTNSSLWSAVTPYTTAQLREVRYAQSGNFMVLTHPDHPPYALSRLTDASWWFRPLTFLEAPAGSFPIFLVAAAGLSVANGTGSRTATAGAALFFTGADVGRLLLRGNSFGRITAVASTTSATIDVVVDFNGATGDWFIQGQPNTSLAFSAIGEVGKVVTITSTPAGWRNGEAFSMLFANSGVFIIESVSPDGITLLARVVRLPTGSATTTNYQVRQRLFGSTAGSVSEYRRDYPKAVAFNDQRLIFANLKGLPVRFLGSVAGDVLDFTQTEDQTDGFTWNIEGAQAIQHLVGDNDLLALTEDGEYAISGADYSSVTNADVRIRRQSTDGASAVAPVKVGREHVFVQRSGRSVMALAFEIAIQGYDTRDLTLLAEHITESGIVEAAFAKRPVPTLFLVRADGKMACLTLDQRQKVTAWWVWETAGVIESVVSVPFADYDEVWIAVKRTINGSDTRFLERVERSYRPTAATLFTTFYVSPTVLGYYLDCARRVDRTPDASPSVVVSTGLANTVVQVVADGVYSGQYTSNGAGEITVPHDFWQVVVGLPYTSTLVPMPQEIPTAAGSGQGRQAQATEITVKLHDTVGGKINGAPILKRDANAIGQPRRLASAVALVRDWTLDLINTDVKVGAQGWKQAESLVTITQDEPLPIHVLQIVLKDQANP